MSHQDLMPDSHQPSDSINTLALLVEPTPYLSELLDELESIVPGGVAAVYISQQLSQEWDLGDSQVEVLPTSSIAAVLRLLTVIRRRKPDSMLIAGWAGLAQLTALLIGRVLGIRTVVTLDTFKPTSRRRAWIRRLVLRLPDHFLPAGSPQARFLRDQGVSDERMTLAWLTSNTERIQCYCKANRADARLRLAEQDDIPTQALAVAFIGRLEWIKGVDLLIDAYRRISSERERALLIVGSGSMAPHLRDLGDEDSTIKFLGRREGDSLLDVYAAADIVVVPSRVEAWGLVVGEALASGSAVIVSDQCGAAEDLVQSTDAGLVFRMDEPNSLKDELQRLFESEALVQQCIRNAKHVASSWSTKDWAACVARELLGAVWSEPRRTDPS
ncbi:glycosyltransferase family 4 protein [bacterium]|nr:glycosyltransferase family 4 protein [bacterium]